MKCKHCHCNIHSGDTCSLCEFKKLPKLVQIELKEFYKTIEIRDLRLLLRGICSDTYMSNRR